MKIKSGSIYTRIHIFVLLFCPDLLGLQCIYETRLDHCWFFPQELDRRRMISFRRCHVLYQSWLELELDVLFEKRKKKEIIEQYAVDCILLRLTLPSVSHPVAISPDTKTGNSSVIAFCPPANTINLIVSSLRQPWKG
jgi:hypothetical protein